MAQMSCHGDNKIRRVYTIKRPNDHDGMCLDNIIWERRVQYGINADTVFSGSSEYEAHDEQREESAHYTAGADPGHPAVGEWPGSSAIYGKGQKYRADRVREVSAEKAGTADGAVWRYSGAA